MEKNLKPIGALLAASWRLYRKHMNVFALISVIPFLFAGVRLALAPYLYNVSGQPASGGAVAVLAVFGLLYIAFAIVLPFAMSIAVHEAEHGKTPNIEEVYKRAFSSIFPYLAVLLLAIITIFGGSVLFIIPGIIVAIYLSLATYVYIFENKKGVDALITSAWYVRNFWWDILARKITVAIIAVLAVFLFSLVVVPILFAFGFGPAVFQFLLDLFVFIFVIPFSLTFAYLIYKDVKSAQHARGRTAPDKTFELEAEKIYVIFIIVAAVAAIIIFLVLNSQTSAYGAIHDAARHYPALHHAYYRQW